MIRQYTRGKKNKEKMNKCLRLVRSFIIEFPYNVNKQITSFKEKTGLSRSAFFRYKRFLIKGTSYRRGEKDSISNSSQYKKDRLNQIIKESYKIEFALNRWMKETGKSRSSFFRLKKLLYNNNK